VARYRASGLSYGRFAAEHGLSVSTLQRWVRRLEAESERSVPAFAEVRVVHAVLGSLEVQHPRGCVVRVTGTVDEAQLTAVLRVLGTC
jgi:transposase-like protein